MKEYFLILDGKTLKIVEASKVSVNRNTPVGDAPLYYLIKPYGGKKEVRFVGSLKIEGRCIKEVCNLYGHRIYS